MPSRPSRRQRKTAVHLKALELERRAGDHEPGAAPGLLAREPELEPGGLLAPAAVVDRRDAGFLDLDQRRPPRAGRSPARRRGRRRRGGRRASASRACCSSTSAETLRSASSSSQRGGSCVSDTVPRPSTVRPAGLALHARRGRAPRRGPPAARPARTRARAGPAARLASPCPVASTRGPSGNASGRGPRTGRRCPAAPSRGCRGRRRRRTARAPARSPLEPRRGVVVLAGRALDVVARGGAAPAAYSRLATRAPAGTSWLRISAGGRE